MKPLWKGGWLLGWIIWRGARHYSFSFTAVERFNERLLCVEALEFGSGPCCCDNRDEQRMFRNTNSNSYVIVDTSDTSVRK